MAKARPAGQTSGKTRKLTVAISDLLFRRVASYRGAKSVELRDIIEPALVAWLKAHPYSFREDDDDQINSAA